MKTEDIKNMALAWKKVQEAAKAPAEKPAEEVLAEGGVTQGKPIKGIVGKPINLGKKKTEGKLPPALAAAIAKKKGDKVEDEDEGDMDEVDPKANKKKFADRKDKDIDNDGDVDSSDKFLHKRRKAIGKKKAASNGKADKDTEVEVQTQEGAAPKIVPGKDASVKGIAKASDDYAKKLKKNVSMDEAKDGMVCKDCGCEQGNIREDCDCENDGSDLQGEHWVAKTDASAKTESTGSPADLMKALDEVNVSPATTKPGNGSPAGEGLSPNAKEQMKDKTVATAEIDGPAVNKKSFDAMRASLKTGKMRDNDNAKGDKAIVKSTKAEGVEVSELSKTTLGSYVKKAVRDVAVDSMAKGVGIGKNNKPDAKTYGGIAKRKAAIDTAVNKMTK